MKMEVSHRPPGSVRRLVTTAVAATLAAAGLVATAGTAQAAEADPKVVATITEATPKTGLRIKVDGTGFSAEESGINVSLGEAGKPSTNLADYIKTTFVGNNLIEDGSFSTTVVLTSTQAGELSADKDYAIYTQKAEDSSQNTETPVEIDVTDFVAKDSTTTLKGLPTSANGGTALTADVVVTSADGTPTGSVELLDGEKSVAEADLTDGKTSISVPTTLAAGKHVLTAKYTGDDVYKESTSDAHSLTIIAVASATTVTAPDGTHGVTGKATVTVKAGLDNVSGTVTLTGDGTTRTKKVVNGTVSFNLTKVLPVGTHTLTATYKGPGGVKSSSATTTYTVAKGAAAAAISKTTKPTTKKRGSTRVTLTSTGLKATGKVRVLLTKSGVTYQSTTGTLNSAGRVRVKLPKVNKRGTWNVVIRYYGDTNHVRADSKKTRLWVAK